MQKFIIMTIVKLDKKNRTMKVVETKTLPYERKEPAGTGSGQKN